MAKKDLAFRSVVMNASGMLGFAPDPRNTPGFEQLGAFVTNPVSLAPRSPAQARAAVAYAGGMLLHSGHPNPGLSRVLAKYQPRWQAAPVPVILHLMVESAYEMETALKMLENADCPAALELGFKPGTPVVEAAGILQLAATEWPVIAQLDPQQMDSILPRVDKGELFALSMAPARGSLVDGDNGRVNGRLYGASLLPHTLLALQIALTFGLPVIAAGGATSRVDVDTLINEGALAVQLDTVLWRVGSTLE